MLQPGPGDVRNATFVQNEDGVSLMQDMTDAVRMQYTYICHQHVQAQTQNEFVSKYIDKLKIVKCSRSSLDQALASNFKEFITATVWRWFLIICSDTFTSTFQQDSN